MWELDYKESWVLKNWCFWTVVLEKTLESPLDCKEIQPVHPQGDQSWVFIGRTDVEAETLILWPPDAKSWFIGKDPDAGKDWGQEEKGTTEDEMVGWHHQLNGHRFGWTLGVSDGQGGLVCCCLWGYKELDTTEWLNWTEDQISFVYLNKAFHLIAAENTLFSSACGTFFRIDHMKMKMLFIQLWPTLCNTMIVACETLWSMEFSRQEYWTGLLFPSPGYFPEPGIEPMSPAWQESLSSELSG